MTRSNRVLNRLILALVGLALIALALYEANRLYPVIALAGIPAPTTAGLWIAAGAALLLVILCSAWILSRGRGHTRTLIRHKTPEGAASIETRVVSDLIADDLARVPDVLGVTARAFRVKGQTALELRVTTRSAADIRLVVDSVERAVTELDGVLETRIPVLLHVASSARASFSGGQRVR